MRSASLGGVSVAANFLSRLAFPARRKYRQWVSTGFTKIKHDGFRIIAQKDATGVRLVTRNGYDLRDRFPLAVAASDALSAQSCIIDSEAIVCDDNSFSVFNLIRYRHYDQLATLCAFDLLELNGRDTPIEERKAALKMLLHKSHPGIDFNRHFDVEGSIVFHHACKLGCERIVSKRLGSVVFRRLKLRRYCRVSAMMRGSSW
jgi:bifunctional non-homologous end joining protein LigD